METVQLAQHQNSILTRMETFKLTQYRYETDAWKRQLGFMTEESIFAKNHIAAILQEPGDTDMLETLESFQSGFIEKDNLISLLRDEIAEFDKLLIRKTFENEKNNSLINSSAKKLRQQIQLAEQAFSSYLKTFNQFLQRIYEEEPWQ